MRQGPKDGIPRERFVMADGYMGWVASVVSKTDIGQVF